MKIVFSSASWEDYVAWQARLLWASLLGYWLYAEVPELWTWIGGAAIFAGSTYIAIHEARAKRASVLKGG